MSAITSLSPYQAILKEAEEMWIVRERRIDGIVDNIILMMSKDDTLIKKLATEGQIHIKVIFDIDSRKIDSRNDQDKKKFYLEYPGAKLTKDELKEIETKLENLLCGTTLCGSNNDKIEFYINWGKHYFTMSQDGMTCKRPAEVGTGLEENVRKRFCDAQKTFFKNFKTEKTAKKIFDKIFSWHAPSAEYQFTPYSQVLLNLKNNKKARYNIVFNDHAGHDNYPEPYNGDPFNKPIKWKNDTVVNVISICSVVNKIAENRIAKGYTLNGFFVIDDHDTTLNNSYNFNDAPKFVLSLLYDFSKEK